MTRLTLFGNTLALDPNAFGDANEMTTLPDIPDADDWTQRLKETPYDPREAIRQEHESWLAELEGLAVEAIATGDWTPVCQHLNGIMAWQDGKLARCPKSQKPALTN